MRLEYRPLLQIQRDLYAIPRGRLRFEQYLRTISSRDGTDIELVPLLAMNPGAKDHVAALLDALLALDADGVGACAAEDAATALEDDPGDFKAALVVVDDLMGGWTNRYAYEYDLRRPAPGDKRFWVTGFLWSSERASARAAQEAVLSAAYRTAYVQRHGPARTLRDLLAQEGYVMSAAGCSKPALDEDEIAYTRAVLSPLLDADDKRTIIECLFGDDAARTLGFTPRGLNPWAGLALALHDMPKDPALQQSPMACPQGRMSAPRAIHSLVKVAFTAESRVE